MRTNDYDGILTLDAVDRSAAEKERKSRVWNEWREKSTRLRFSREHVASQKQYKSHTLRNRLTQIEREQSTVEQSAFESFAFVVVAAAVIWLYYEKCNVMRFPCWYFILADGKARSNRQRWQDCNQHEVSSSAVYVYLSWCSLLVSSSFFCLLIEKKNLFVNVYTLWVRFSSELILLLCSTLLFSLLLSVSLVTPW